MPSPTDNNTLFTQPMNYWYAALRPFLSLYAAPQSLDQSILPWTFAGLVVNENNSGDPAAERAIVNKDSYGRQLGRISDALESLVETLPAAKRKEKAVQAFLDMKADIDKIKRQAEAARFDKVLADLEALKQRDAAAFTERLERLNALAKK